MSLDAAAFDFQEQPTDRNERRIYICESGVRLEEKHFRQTISPEEFVALLRQIFRDANDTKFDAPINL